MNMAKVFGLWLVLAATPALAQSVNTSEVDRFMTDQMKRFDVPGVGLAIIKDGKVVYAKGYGVRDLKSNTPVSADTLFAIGSATKSFTALGVMQQVEAGRLNLDAPVNSYLPDLKFSDPTKGKTVLLHHLLSMSSGLPTADNEWTFNPSIDTRQKMLETVANIPFTAAPGTTFQYCNQNFIMAGAALEAVTKGSWEAYTKTRILQPLGMKRSVFEFADAFKDGNFAAGYTAGFSGVQSIPPFDRLVIAGPAGSIHSSATEMGRYLAFQMGDGSVAGTRLISKANLDAMHRQQTAIKSPPDGTLPGYGFGWFTGEYRGLKIVEHGGNINGYTAEMEMVPQKGLGIVLLTNLDSANEFTTVARLGLTEQLTNLEPRSDFSDSLYLEQKAKLEAAKSYAPKPEDLQAVVGPYKLVNGDTFTVSLQDGKLVAELGGGRFPMMAVAPNEFAIDTGAVGAVILLRFQPLPDGSVWLYQDDQAVGFRVAGPTVTPASSAGQTTAFQDPQGRFSLSLPAGVRLIRQQSDFSLAQIDAQQAALVFLTGDFDTNLETSVRGLLRRIDPGFKLAPAQTNALPEVNGIVWTQFLYPLPGDQTLVVLATHKENSVYAIALQAKTGDLHALSGTLQQIAASYKILR